MTQRSPHNARYQKHTKPHGKTRKSAAAAKPKRGSVKSGSAKKAASRRPIFPPLPPEVRVWRNIWWGMLAGAVLVSTSALLLRNVPPWNTVLLVVAYVLIFGGIAIDFWKVRPTRLAQMKGTSSAKKNSSTDKPDDKKS